MKSRFRYFIELFLSFILLFSCAKRPTKPIIFDDFDSLVDRELLKVYDSTRNRTIPIAIYSVKTDSLLRKTELVVLSHGWGSNDSTSYLSYSYLANALALKGYTIVSIQHELESDPMLAMVGDMKITRRENWDRGAKNIEAVLTYFQARFTAFDFSKTILIGHSNGGDISVLYATLFPANLAYLITLDNRRMLLPRAPSPKLFSLRSSDQKADDGVLLSAEEIQLFGSKIVYSECIKHGDMSNDGSREKKTEISQMILAFLQNN